MARSWCGLLPPPLRPSGADPRRGSAASEHGTGRPRAGPFLFRPWPAWPGVRRATAPDTMSVSHAPTSAMALHPHDLYDVRSLLGEEERAVQDTVARFTDE